MTETTTERIAVVRRAKEDALEAADYVRLGELREEEKTLLAAQSKEFKPNARGH